MSHQQGAIWVPSDNEDGGDFEQSSLDKVPVMKTWPIEHYGGSEHWHQKGEITVRALEEGLGGTYLECTVEGKPFLSIKGDYDQWGTWYTLKLDDGGVLRPQEDGLITYGQEWQCQSFLRALGSAILEFANMSEPQENGSWTDLQKEAQS